jgi:hypothetical protein
MPQWIKNLLMIIIPEIIKNLFVSKPQSCPEKKDGEQEKN